MTEIQPIPPHVRDARPWAQVRSMGKPGDMTDAECGTAEMQMAFEEVSPGRRFQHWYAHFKLTAEEVEALRAGGTVELCLIGSAPQPFGLVVWPSGPTSADVSREATP